MVCLGMSQQPQFHSEVVILSALMEQSILDEQAEVQWQSKDFSE